MKKLVMIMMSLVWLSSVACSKKGGSSAVATPPVTYSWSGNVCKDNNGNTVDNSLCPQGTGGYYISNNCCYNSSNQQVDMSYCTGQAVSCNGNYWGVADICVDTFTNQEVSMNNCTAWSWTGMYKVVTKVFGVICADNFQNQGYNNCSGYWLTPNKTGNYNSDFQTQSMVYCK